MSKKFDVFTELGHAVLDARHNGTSLERAEAARLTLTGGLPPLPPHIALMTETPWDKVAQVAISPDGKIAVLGIEHGGNKEVVERRVIDRRWTCRVITSTDGDYRVDHLHYPEGSEDVAFTVTAPDGKTRVYWGDWKIDVNTGTSDKVVGSISCFMQEDRRYCLVTHTDVCQMKLVIFADDSPNQLAMVKQIVNREVAVQGRLTKSIIVMETMVVPSEMHRITLMSFEGVILWQSDWYNSILPGSAMERDGEFSVVGIKLPNMGIREVCLVGLLGAKGMGHFSPNVLHCLPSGRLLVAHKQPGAIVLWDCWQNRDRQITLEDMEEVGEIVEISSGLVIHAIMRNGDHRLLVVHENYDSVPGVLQIRTDGEVTNLRRWDDTLVFQVGDRLQVVEIEDLESWLVETDDEVYTDPITSYPLYTSFDRLAPTNEGILGWHFVNGTFCIFRY